MKTWSPFQSAEVREICTHMTDMERAGASRRAALYGLWVSLTLAGPLALAATTRHPAFIAVASMLILIHITCIPLWLKMQRTFLCSTVWAREHDFTPDRLRLFTFR